MSYGNLQSLHSRYNPRAEAGRYISALKLDDEIRFFILVEPGMGYIVNELRKNHPRARIISLHASDDFRETEAELRADACWNPLSEIPLQSFLENEIPDAEAPSIKIIEWRPALPVYGQAYARLFSEAVEFIKRAGANARTTAAFGRRWFKNFFRNLLFVRDCICPVALDLPVIAAGAGPGLEDVIPLIREARGKNGKSGLLVLAVSSAVSALKAGGVEPDLVIATDGGGWARLHLFEYYRDSCGASERPKKHFLAASMNAALPSEAAGNPLLAASDGSLWQNTVLEGLGIPFCILPQRGTVSASALDLAFGLSSGKIFLCGIDLAHRDLQTHARPYSFDRLWEEKADRFRPYYSQIFSRSLEIKSGGSHGIYASWFGRQIENYPKRLFSLGKNNAAFKSLSVSSLPSGLEKPRAEPIFKTRAVIFKNNPAEKGAALLIAALNNSASSGKILEELAPLIAPGEEKLPPKELAGIILDLTKPYRERPLE